MTFEACRETEVAREWRVCLFYVSPSEEPVVMHPVRRASVSRLP